MENLTSTLDDDSEFSDILELIKSHESESQTLLQDIRAFLEEDERQQRRLFQYVDFLYGKIENKYEFLPIRNEWFHKELQLGELVMKISREAELLVDVLFIEDGEYCLKKLIEALELYPKLASIFTEALSKVFFEMMTNNATSSVIFYCFNTLADDQNRILYESILDHFIPLATDQHGCISLEECIKFKYFKGRLRNRLWLKIIHHAVELAEHPLGNYVLQEALDLHERFLSQSIAWSLRDHYAKLSSQKNASHVIKKCILSHETCMTIVVQELLNYELPHELACNPFGNYVIQTALAAAKVSKDLLYSKLVERLEEHPKKLQLSYGKKVLQFIRDLKENKFDESVVKFDIVT